MTYSVPAIVFPVLFLIGSSAATFASDTIPPNGPNHPEKNRQTESPPLFLNEIMASNGSSIEDEDGDSSDWIELYYDGEEPLSLHYVGLTDDPSKRFQWMFPDTVIHPGEYLLVWASGKDRATPGEPLHTNFRIAQDGEDIMLSHPVEGLLDHFEARRIPTDISAGRVPDGYGDWFFFNLPTPGRSNETPAFEGITEPALFSHEAGFYTEDFQLEVVPRDTNSTIHFTLDGSRPTSNSPVFDGPLTVHDRSGEANVFSTIRTSARTFDWRQWHEPDGPVAKATIIRTVTLRENHLPVYDKRTYFVMSEGADRYEVPVISITTDSLNLFDYRTGIYIPGIHRSGGGTGNEFQRGSAWEREATMEYFDETGERVLHQDIGIRIHGGFSRELAQKSLRLYARNEYGDNRFRHRFFPDLEDSVFNRLILRNAGNTWGEDMFMDAAAQSLVRHFNMDTQAYQPAVLFLNGEYWGIHNIRERYDKHYLERVYGIDPENIDLLTRDWQVKEGDSLHYVQMLDFVRSADLGDDEAMAKLSTMIDLDNLLDYYSAQIYFGNNDWPHNNIDFWRSRVAYDPDADPGHDGRWRWLMFDVDRSLGHATGPEFDMIAWMMQPVIREETWPTELFLNLMENEQFVGDFINRIADHLNTAFRCERVEQVIDSLKSPVAGLIGEHIHRWSLPESVHAWEGYVQEMYRYACQRPAYLRDHLREHFDIPDMHVLRLENLDSGHGHIIVNSIPVAGDIPGIADDPEEWAGIYFDGIPIEVAASPRDGMLFEGWVINGELSPVTDTLITLLPEEDLHIEALFSEPTSADPGPQPNQIALHQNYPNPFNPSTTISYELSESSEVQLEVYDILGQRVALLTDEIRSAGTHSVNWDASGLASGVYIMQLTVSGVEGAAEEQHTGKMTLVR
ncbi:CotH kinase family protein [Balneolales bacterium ANBcel1]|nr:CotH kinase family protein [Balneolales bacterium ANBcel1]